MLYSGTLTSIFMDYIQTINNGLFMIFIIGVAILLSLFSTAVMSYIAMATPIGPWIGPTLVLLAIPIFKFHRIKNRDRGLALSSLAGSLGGIIATAFGFSFPTLYFLDPSLFNSWMSNPFYFCSVLGIFTIVAGFCALWIVDYYQKTLLDEQKLAFPIGQVMHSMIVVHKEAKKAYQLLYGIVGTLLFCIGQDGLGSLKGFIPKTVLLCSARSFYGIISPAIRFDIWPMLWAIGFITGHVIALPLAVGAVAQAGLVSPIHNFFFAKLSSVEFTLAFCSGMVLIGAFFGFLGLPALVKKTLYGLRNQKKANLFHDIPWKEGLAALTGSALFLTYFKFSLLAQLFILISTFIWTYQTMVIAGKIGLATLGRYATFVMIPAMIFFKLNSVQIVLVATFVEVVGGIAVDLLFGRKLAQMSDLDIRVVRRFQILGIIIAALSIGMVFWLLISHFGLGSEHLVAYRAQSRQLLISAQNFNYWVLGIGALFGVLLKQININPALALGGLLMPLNLSLGLIFGGLCARLVKKPSAWEPFLSGVFASNALWMLIKALI